MQIVSVPRAFSLSEPLSLPIDVVEHVVDREHLFVSNKIVAYIVTDLVGALVVRACQQGLSLGGAISLVESQHGYSHDHVLKSTRAALVEIERNRFYDSTVAHNSIESDFPLHCYVTKRCTLSCTHCYVGAGPQVDTSAELTTSEWEAVIDGYCVFVDSERLPRTTVTFTGGEPLLRDDIFSLAAIAATHGHEPTLFTNGTLIDTQATATAVARAFPSVQISLDGATDSVNDLIRGRGSFRRIVRALELMAATTSSISVGVTLMPSNAVDLEENLADLLSQFGSRLKVRIGRAFVMGRADASVTFETEAWARGANALHEIMSALYKKGLWRPRQFVPNIRSWTCGYGQAFAIGSDGSAYGCAIESQPVGNVRLTPVHELARTIRGLSKNTGVDNIPNCAACHLKHFCLGTCRVNNAIYTGSLARTYCTEDYKAGLLRELVLRHSDKQRPIGRFPGGDGSVDSVL